MSTSDFTFFEYYSEESIRFNSVCACASMRTDDTAPRRRSRTTTLESPLLLGGFQRSDSGGQAWQQGLYLLSIPQPQFITCLALISNSTQTVSVVQIFQDIHTLFYLRGKISPSLPICFIWNGCSRGFQGKYYPGIPLQSCLLSVLEPSIPFWLSSSLWRVQLSVASWERSVGSIPFETLNITKYL